MKTNFDQCLAELIQAPIPDPPPELGDRILRAARQVSVSKAPVLIFFPRGPLTPFLEMAALVMLLSFGAAWWQGQAQRERALTRTALDLDLFTPRMDLLAYREQP